MKSAIVKDAVRFGASDSAAVDVSFVLDQGLLARTGGNDGNVFVIRGRRVNN